MAKWSMPSAKAAVIEGLEAWAAEESNVWASPCVVSVLVTPSNAEAPGDLIMERDTEDFYFLSGSPMALLGFYAETLGNFLMCRECYRMTKREDGLFVLSPIPERGESFFELGLQSVGFVNSRYAGDFLDSFPSEELEVDEYLQRLKKAAA